MTGRRPEKIAPPDVYYNDSSAKQYADNSRILNIQRRMANRAIELLNYPKNTCGYFLDLGCGSGISGEALEDNGFEWIGLDISKDMIACALQRDVSGDLFESDIGNGIPFREGIFDGCISISTLQWLLNSDSSNSNPKLRLTILFKSLFKCLKRGARAVFQIYPENSTQLEYISDCAMKAGFIFSVVTDFPNSSQAKKHYVILDAGSRKRHIPKNVIKQNELNQNSNNDKLRIKNFDSLTILEKQKIRSYKLHGLKQKENNKTKKRGSERFQNRDWIMESKRRREMKGLPVPNDSKYTGRKRNPKF